MLMYKHLVHWSLFIAVISSLLWAESFIMGWEFYNMSNIIIIFLLLWIHSVFQIWMLPLLLSYKFNYASCELLLFHINFSLSTHIPQNIQLKFWMYLIECIDYFLGGGKWLTYIFIHLLTCCTSITHSLLCFYYNFEIISVNILCMLC